MKQIRRVFRLVRLALHVMVGVVLTLVFAGLLRMPSGYPFYQRLYAWWLRKTATISGVTIKTVGEPAGQGIMLVSNHISWLDIPVLGAVARPRFLSKQEVRHWPVIGWLAAKSGTLFITRGKPGAAAQAAQTITRALQAGYSVLLFPEGTTTTGNDVRTFHARLFAPALDMQAWVQPMALRYPDKGGQTNPVVPYVDRQSLWDNLTGLLMEDCVAAEVHFLPPIPTKDMNRKTLASTCEKMIGDVIRQKSHT